MRDDVGCRSVVGQHRLLVRGVISRSGGVFADGVVVAHIGGGSLDLVDV